MTTAAKRQIAGERLEWSCGVLLLAIKRLIAGDRQEGWDLCQLW